MAKGCYVGVNGVAHKVKKGYIGVDGKARLVKKAYIGIGGVARPCWSGGELAYYGTAENMGAHRTNFAAATAGNYAIFAAGMNDGLSMTTMDTYNASLTHSYHTNAHNLFWVNKYLAATSIGNYAIFAGGRRRESSDYSYSLSDACAYDSSLTAKSVTRLNNVDVMRHAAASNSKYAMFGGGYYYYYYYDEEYYNTEEVIEPKNRVTAYDSSLTRSGASLGLNDTAYDFAAATAGNYVLFGGGRTRAYSATYTSAVTAFDTSLTKRTATSLSSARIGLKGASVGNYVLFGGGYTTSGYTAAVDIYNASLTKTTASMSVARYNYAATTVGDYAVFAGGVDSNGLSIDTVDVFDASLTRTVGTSLSVPRGYLEATTVGNYALFAGGNKQTTVQTAVDVYMATT